MSLEQRWHDQLTHLKAQGRYRRLQTPCGIDFSSNDYLGFARSEPDELASPAAADLARSGAASRLLRGQHAIWDDIEQRLAAWHNAEAALVFTSGYVANEGLLSTVVGPEDVVLSDQCNHASIIDGLRLSRAKREVFRHNDVAHVESCLKEAARARRGGQQIIVVIESLFGMEGERAPLVELAELTERQGARLIVDEAHATGCFGPDGSGLVDELGLRPRVLATVHTGGKALGVPGAYVCGSALLRDLLINRCRHLLFTTALPPLLGAWWLQAVARTRQADVWRAALQTNVRHFRAALRQRGFDCAGRDYIVPFLVGADASAVAAAQRLQARGFDVRAIRPPTVPAGTARLRISIHADHDESTLASLAEALANQ
jgi:8-amino-7-oxononanoate synthase